MEINNNMVHFQAFPNTQNSFNLHQNDKSDAQKKKFEEIEQIINQKQENKYDLGISTLYSLLTLCQVKNNFSLFPEIYNFIETFLPHVEENDLELFENNISVFVAETPNCWSMQRSLAFELAKHYHKIANQDLIGEFKNYKRAMYLYSIATSISMNKKMSADDIYSLVSAMISDIRKKCLDFRIDTLIFRAVGGTDDDYRYLEKMMHNAKKQCCSKRDFELFKELCEKADEIIGKSSSTSKEAIEKKARCIELFTELKPDENSNQDIQDPVIKRFAETFKKYRQIFEQDPDPDNLQTFQMETQKSFSLFFKDLWIEACSILAVDPDSADPRAMGSVGRGEQLPYSDLEWAIIVQQERDVNVFKMVSEIIEIFAISIGETVKNGWIHFSSTSMKSGFCIDTCEVNTSKAFLSSMSLETCPEKEFSANCMANTIRDSMSLIRSDNPEEDLFQKNIQEKLAEEHSGKFLAQLRSCRLIESLIGQDIQYSTIEELRKTDSHQILGYRTWWKEPFEDQSSIFLKYQYSNLLNHMIKSLGLYYKIPHSNSLLLIDKPELKKVFTPKSAVLLKQGITIVYKIRKRLQLNTNSQTEEVVCNSLKPPFLLEKEKNLLWKIYWFVLFPLYEQIEKFLKDPSQPIDFLDYVFHYIIEKNPTNKLRLIGNLATLANDHEKYYHVLSQDVKLEPLREAYLEELDPLKHKTLYEKPNQDGFTQAFRRNLVQLTDSEGTIAVNFSHNPKKTYYFSEKLAKEFILNGAIKTYYPNSLHNVARIQQNNVDFHAKENPNLPLIEYAVTTFLWMVMGKAAPNIDLAVIEGLKYPVLFSETIKGNPLSTFPVGSLDNRQLTWLQLCSILLRPGDGHGDNFIVENGKIITLDNEMSGNEGMTCDVSDSVKNLFNASTIRFRSAIFLLDQKRNLDPEVIREFCKLDIALVTEKWLNAIENKKKQMEKLFSKEELKSLYKQPPEKQFSLNLFREGFITTLIIQFEHLKKELSKKQDWTSTQLLELLISFQTDYPIKNQIGKLIAHQYNRAYLLKKPLSEKYEWLTGYSRTIPSSIALKEIYRRVPTYEEIEKRRRLSPGQAKKEINTIRLNTIDSSVSTITEGKKIISIDCSMDSINSIKLEKETLRALKFRINSILPDKFKAISISKSATLNLQIATSLLHKEITILKIDYCPLIDRYAVDAIHKVCGKTLRYLSLKGSTSLNHFAPLNSPFFKTPKFYEFFGIEELDISDCSKLQSIALKMPKIQKMFALNCPNYDVAYWEPMYNEILLHTSSYKHFLKNRDLDQLYDRSLINKKITEISSVLFFEFLTDLDLSKNLIKEIPRNIKRMKNLKSLNLADNEIQNMPDELTECKSIELLDLSSNKIKTIPNHVDKFISLLELKLANNKIQTIPEELYACGKLTSLNLSSNKINAIPKNVNKLTSIKKLNLSINSISNVPSEIVLCTKINSLKLSRNKIRTIPLEIDKLSFLKFCDLSHNKIEKIPSAITKSNIAELDLSHNRISYVPEDIDNAKFLRIVNLANNRIEKVPKCNNLALSNLIGTNIEGMAHFMYFRPDEVDELLFSYRSFDYIIYHQIKNTHGKIDNLGIFRIFDLTNNNIINFPTSFFYNVNLKRICFEKNQIYSVPKEIGNLHFLAYINLSNNRIEKIPNEITKCEKVNTLNLNNNRIENIPEDIHKMVFLSQLGIANNQIVKISKNIIGCKNLKLLNLKNNKIENIPEDIHKMDSLFFLYLDNNKIHQIPETIGKSKNLEELSLSSNQITEIPNSLFQCKKIKELYLESNKIEKISDEIHNMTSLKILSLGQNQITKIPNSLVQCKKIKELYLGSNKIETIPDEIENLTSLKILTLEQNQITEISKSLYQCKNIKVLYLGANQIEKIPDEIENLTSLEKLDLGQNQITKIPHSLTLCKSIKELYLESNKIEKISDEIHNMTSLEILSLGQNQITKIPHSLTHCKDIKLLSLQDNKIKIIPDEIENLTSLEYLSFDKNQITEIPSSLSKFKNIIELDFSNNHLNSFPTKITSSQSIQVLKLAFNKITNVPSDIKNMSALKRIDMSYNLINEISEKISECGSLEKIDFSHNKMNHIPKFIGSIKQLSTADFSFNKIDYIMPYVAFFNNLKELNISNNKIWSVFVISDYFSYMHSSCDFFPGEHRHCCNVEVSKEISYYKMTRFSKAINGLERLDLSYNKLEHLDYFPTSRTLRLIDLSNNSLTSLPEVFKTIDSLEELNLSHNKIEDLPKSLAKCKELKIINLSYNKIKKISEVFNNIKLDLRQNPINLSHKLSIERLD